MKSPNTNFNEVDISFAAGDVAAGRSAVKLETERGPLGRPDLLITSWEQYKRYYGGLTPGNDGPLLAKRALDRGTALRVSRLLHYTDPTDADTLDAEFSAALATHRHVLGGVMGVDHTAEYTIGGVTVSQVFTTDTLTTLKLLASKIKETFATVLDVVVVSASQFIVIPTGGAIVPTFGITTIGAAPPATTTTNSNSFVSSQDNATVLFTLSPKYPGIGYDKLKATVKPSANGDASAFDLIVEMVGEDNLKEEYLNNKIPGAVSIADSGYLSEVTKTSELVDVVYSDLSAIANLPIIPATQVLKFSGGSNGGAITVTDIIGDSAAKTGLYDFDGIDDVMQVGVFHPLASGGGVPEALSAYVSARKDLQGFVHLEGLTENALVAERDAINVDDSYIMFFAGGVNQVDPQTGVQRVISELGDVMGIAGYSEIKAGPQRSFSGYNRGLLNNALGSGNKMGAAGNIAGLNLLAQRQINVVINRNKKTVLWGSFTGQKNISKLSFANVRRFHIYLKKALGPVLELFIEEPTDLETFKKIYLTVKPFMDEQITKRAIYDYRWEGDQFADTIDDVVINKKADLDLGKYKVRLFCKDIVSLQEFSIDIVITPSAVSFEDAIAVTNQ